MLPTLSKKLRRIDIRCNPRLLLRHLALGGKESASSLPTSSAEWQCNSGFGSPGTTTRLAPDFNRLRRKKETDFDVRFRRLATLPIVAAHIRFRVGLVAAQQS
jgi:hypothetical protein